LTSDERPPTAAGAAAIFVKTPGLSPVKTRLAASIGRADAERFHTLSAEAVAGVVRRAAGDRPGTLAPYWAVAERGAGGWGGMEVVAQGEGGLGERLSRVYDALLARHRFVLFVGADSPQLSPGALADAAERAGRGGFVLGPAEDGGFYLFGGSRPLPREVWTRVPYSEAGTLEALETELARHGPIERVGTLFDVDTPADLRRLRALLRGDRALLPEQAALAAWLATLL
jgi:glycosyltransferase A (GT-A) superfamily protein (DUF2064 family)